MLRSASRVARRRPRAACAALALAALVLAGAARVLAPPQLAAVAEFPRVRPADLAHLLADISTHTFVPSSWTLEEESGNYTSWRYAVAYSCGARCSGRTAVTAHEHFPALAHGAAAAHVVRLRARRCRRLPLLPWPQLCDEIETEWNVSGAGAGGGARLSERARWECGAAAAVLLQCGGARELREHHARQLRRLRDLLQGRAAPLHA